MTDFQGSPAEATVNGRLYGGYLGAEYDGLAGWKLGVALSHTTGEMTVGAGDDGYEMDTRLTSMLPYLRWTVREGLSVWGIAGYGLGELDVVDDSGIAGDTTLDIYLGALGLRQTLRRWSGGMELALKADAFGVRTESEARQGLAAATGDATRVRALLESTGEWLLDEFRSLRPRLEGGVRLDGGGAESGLGLELGAGLTYQNQLTGLSVEAQGRVLLAHNETDYEEWGASVAVRLDPGAAGAGWSMSLAPMWGNTMSGVQTLWEQEQALRRYAGLGDGGTASGWRPDRTAMRVAYGWLRWGGLLTPYSELELSKTGDRRARLGLQFIHAGQVWPLSWARSLRLELALEQQVAPGATPDHSLNLSGVLNY